MKLYLDQTAYIDTNKGLDISLSLSSDNHGVRAWYLDYPIIEPVRENGFIGAIKEGGAVNFRNIRFNPHGHVTHTECLGHITPEVYSVNEHLKTYFFKCTLVTIRPEPVNEDNVVTLAQIKAALTKPTEAIVIRTLPIEIEKIEKNYSATNPPYLQVEIVAYLNELGVKHLLIDLPSVDKEIDGGVLAFHHQFWGVPENMQFDKTITELIYVKDSIEDGDYILNLQVAPFENDAAPSRPVLFKIEQ
jgi:kynurenine formamidase